MSFDLAQEWDELDLAQEWVALSFHEHRTGSNFDLAQEWDQPSCASFDLAQEWVQRCNVPIAEAQGQRRAELLIPSHSLSPAAAAAAAAAAEISRC